MKLKGQLSIARCSDHTIHIELNDVDSRMRVVDIQMSPEALGNCITGLGYQEVMFEVREQGINRLGKKMEHQTIRVPFTHDGYDRKRNVELFKEAVKPYEVEGWMCDDLEAVNNTHKYGPDGVTTIFRRYV